MKLLNSLTRRNPRLSATRRTKAFRPAMRPYLEGLEPRTVLSGASAAVIAAAVPAAPAVPQSPLTITGVNITNLAVTGANALNATFNLVGTLNTKSGPVPITIPNLQLPITLTPTASTTGGSPVLDLSLQIPDLNLLGLHVRLDNCNSGPVTVDITAIPSTQPGGGLLGDLLSSVDGLLSSSGGLLNLGGLTGQVTGALTTVLNGLLTDLTTGSTTGTGGTMGSGSGQTDTIPAGDTELVNLHLGPINADILGLDIQTSQICLNVYADPNGGLLGNLLSSLDNLLNNGGNTGHAGTVLAGNILRDIQQLGL